MKNKQVFQRVDPLLLHDRDWEAGGKAGALTVLDLDRVYRARAKTQGRGKSDE